MKDTEQIKEVIRAYNKLVNLAEKKIKFIQEIDNKYHTARGIESIYFDSEDTISVLCDDSCMGHYDSLSFSFPLYYLSLNDDELKFTVLKEKESRLVEEKKKTEQIKIKNEQDKEQRELEQYRKLKEKFGN